MPGRQCGRWRDSRHWRPSPAGATRRPSYCQLSTHAPTGQTRDASAYICQPQHSSYTQLHGYLPLSPPLLAFTICRNFQGERRRREGTRAYQVYDEYYPDMQPPLNRGLVVAGAILHDIGKLREIEWQPEGPAYTAAGRLVGHILQGRDIVREAAAAHPLDEELLLRLEHIIIAHQRLPEWGSPKPPMTPEALLVHYADDIDAKYNMMYVTLRDDTTPGPLTSKKNQLFQQVYRGAEKR